MKPIKKLKMISKKSWLIACILCFGVVFTTTYAYSTTVSVTLDDTLQMRLNGEAFYPTEADGTPLEPLLHNDRTYLPVRAILERVGVFVDFESDTNTVIMRDDNALLNRANMALYSLKYQDAGQLAQFVHPKKGLTFAPYATFEQSNQLFSAQEVKTLFTDRAVRVWGVTDGEGADINTTFADYYERYVFDRDFTNADAVGKNTIILSGNSLVNIDEAYPDAGFVEYAFHGSEEFGEMDWAALRLVFEQYNGEWYLVAIAHDQWTI